MATIEQAGWRHICLDMNAFFKTLAWLVQSSSGQMKHAVSRVCMQAV